MPFSGRKFLLSTRDSGATAEFLILLVWLKSESEFYFIFSFYFSYKICISFIAR